MIGDILFYTGLFLIMFGFGWGVSKKGLLIFLLCSPIIAFLEPFLSPILPILPSNHFVSFVVNGYEAGAFSLGYLVSKKILQEERKKTSIKEYKK